ncbi:MAG: nicotinate-nicotinamide nucleotide adenylyltransferase [Deltaproteobacteria bacterium]|nr:MAG: nicotinate-nicotinamide nucleotide adenylyltransferase [Deltaproteobacteria bacterium]
MIKKSLNIALFGGSFNPPHEGHLEIARRVAKRKTIDEVWILPVYRHAFGKKMKPFSVRLTQCQSVFSSLKPKVKVKDWEKKRGGVSFTLDLILFLKKKFPKHQFYWVMGSDDYAEREKWKSFSEIEKLVKMIVFPRGADSPIPNISSTEIRNKKF